MGTVQVENKPSMRLSLMATRRQRRAVALLAHGTARVTQRKGAKTQSSIIRARNVNSPTRSSKLDAHAFPSPLYPIALQMFVQRSAIAAARRVAPRALARRTFTTTFVRRGYTTELSYDPPLTPLQATRTRRPVPLPTLRVFSRATRSLTVCCAPAPTPFLLTEHHNRQPED